MQTEPLNHFSDDYSPMTGGEIAAVEQQLRQLPLPCSQLNTAHLLFEAGRLAARQELPRSSGRGWFWPASSLLGLSVSVVLAVLYLGERRKPLSENPAVSPAAVTDRSPVSDRPPGPASGPASHGTDVKIAKKSMPVSAQKQMAQKQLAQKQSAQKPSVRKRGPTGFPRTTMAARLWRSRYPVLSARVEDLPRGSGGGSCIEPSKTWQQYRHILMAEEDRSGEGADRQHLRQSVSSRSVLPLFSWPESFLQRGSL